MIWIVYGSLGLGLIFQLLGTLALHRFPDPYTRLHGSTMCTTFGSIFLYIGLILFGMSRGWLSYPIHIFLIMVLLLLTNPTGSHAIARPAHRSGLKPMGAVVDKLRGDEQDG